MRDQKIHKNKKSVAMKSLSIKRISITVLIFFFIAFLFSTNTLVSTIIKHLLVFANGLSEESLAIASFPQAVNFGLDS